MTVLHGFGYRPDGTYGLFVGARCDTCGVILDISDQSRDDITDLGWTVHREHGPFGRLGARHTCALCTAT